jgi:hypothetical protein
VLFDRADPDRNLLDLTSIQLTSIQLTALHDPQQDVPG